jgi:hypothetical protein
MQKEDNKRAEIDLTLVTESPALALVEHVQAATTRSSGAAWANPRSSNLDHTESWRRVLATWPGNEKSRD